MRVCTTCRRVVQQYVGDDCNTCGTVLLSAPYRWSPPKHKDKRAWRRIANGEWLWDRRRVARSKMRRNTPETYTKQNYHMEPVVDCDCGDLFCRYRHKEFRRVVDSEYEVTNFRASPDVDMGG